MCSTNYALMVRYCFKSTFLVLGCTDNTSRCCHRFFTKILSKLFKKGKEK